MFNKALYRTEMKNNWKLLVIFALILSMYFTIMLTMYDPKLGSALDELTNMMPEIMAMAGMSGSTATLVSFLNTYLYGMLMVMFPFLLMVLLSLKLVAKKIDSGSMAYLLSAGTTRSSVWRTELLVLLTNLFLLITYCTVLGIICSELMFPGELDIAAYLRLNVGVFCLHLALTSIVFLFSCICSEYRQAATYGAGIGIVFILIQMLSNMKGDLENLKYATILTLFDQEGLLTQTTQSYLAAAGLLVIAILCFFAAQQIFKRRSLSL